MAALIIVIGAAIIFYEIYNITKAFPSEMQIREVYSAAKADKNIHFVGFDELPTHTINAVLAAENSNYLEDGSSFANCVWVSFLKMFSVDQDECDTAILIFASRISYSALVSKNGARRTSHLVAFLYSWRLENALGSKGVFELLINEAYFGQKAFGIANAAKIYFGKQVKELTIAQSALLAGMLKAPSRYSPIRNPKLTKERRDFVLSKMKARGMITVNEFEDAMKADL